MKKISKRENADTPQWVIWKAEWGKMLVSPYGVPHVDENAPPGRVGVGAQIYVFGAGDENKKATMLPAPVPLCPPPFLRNGWKPRGAAYTK